MVNAMATIGLLHPGEMGASLGAALVEGGHTVLSVRRGRSQATLDRAGAAGIRPVETLDDLTGASQVVISVCPPDAAETVAQQVAATGFSGTYVDANAVSPATAARLAQVTSAVGAHFVDGDIIGGPIRRGGGTRLYLSGRRAREVADLTGGHPETVVLGEDPTAASTLKMCYAAWTKGTSALLLAIVALASQAGLSEALQAEWARSQPDLGERVGRAVRSTPAKAWRFAGEMEEIAATFAAAGLSGGFGTAAADTYRRLAPFKDGPAPDLPELLAALLAER
jgi:3-hydroxyisobutyrate dehydrogenase-like beta-hydroxyacid dehydrogenase